MAKLNGEITSMIDRRTVQAAQQLVAARKATLAAQWLALQARIRDVATQPATLGAVALAGGIVGWHSAAPEKVIEVECKCPEKPRPSVLGAGMRTLAIATLQAAASIASEEFLRSTLAQAARDGGADHTQYAP
ncbi:MAG: hypothetical protein AUG50_08055 [Betaproteobacteria bacterium 13_1_20CM_3_63_8]|nr:MAG: hypothetical protein AUG50_08055 [Betaproteobacteria bacterium 13_1_20CM_3_63_8]